MNHHPSKELLEMYTTADLDESLSAIVAAHVESCLECRGVVKAIEESSGNELFSQQSKDSLDPVSAPHSSWQSVLSKISGTVVISATNKKAASTSISIDGQSFDLPRSLQNLDPSKLKWMSFGQGGKISRLKGNSKDSLLLIYLAANEEVPEHTHAGAEYSYVISGSFAADGTEYQSGDFSYSNSEIRHTPRATSPDGCLLISKVENQLNFFQGILRPLNGLIWSFLNWKFTRL